MIDHQFGDYAQISFMRGVEKRPEIVECAEIRIYIKIIGNVVAGSNQIAVTPSSCR